VQSELASIDFPGKPAVNPDGTCGQVSLTKKIFNCGGYWLW
jgi:hypothetical protein